MEERGRHCKSLDEPAWAALLCIAICIAQGLWESWRGRRVISELPVIWELSKGCPTCNDGFRHTDFGTNNAAQVAKHVAQRLDHEFLFFSLLLQFTSCGGDLGSSCLDNVVR